MCHLTWKFQRWGGIALRVEWWANIWLWWYIMSEKRYFKIEYGEEWQFMRRLEKELFDDEWYSRINSDWFNAYWIIILYSKVVIIGVTYSQKYKHILEEFVSYCNEQPRTSRADHLESLLISFIHKKMERYQWKGSWFNGKGNWNKIQHCQIR